MRSQGWQPVYVSEQTVRTEARKGFQRHVLRFRNFERDFTINGSTVEMVLVNSHDGLSSYQIHAGVFRLVCSNGLVVADSLFDTLRVRHQGNMDKDFIDVSYKVIHDVPKIAEEVRSFGQVVLNRDEQEAFAKSALTLRWDRDQNETVPIVPDQLLRTRRMADQPSDLYTTFNTIQENLVRGGLAGRNRTGRRTRTREVKGINENIRLNKSLWQLAQEMKRIKTTGGLE